MSSRDPKASPAPIKRQLWIGLGWVFSGLALYLGCLVLDLYWNLAEWKPRWDWTAFLLFAWIAASLLTYRLLTRSLGGTLSITISLIVSVALASLGIYAAKAELLSEGLFGREASSPLWYRGGRLVLMALPLILCVTILNKRRRTRSISE